VCTYGTYDWINQFSHELQKLALAKCFSTSLVLCILQLRERDEFWKKFAGIINYSNLYNNYNSIMHNLLDNTYWNYSLGMKKIIPLAAFKPATYAKCCAWSFGYRVYSASKLTIYYKKDFISLCHQFFNFFLKSVYRILE